MTSIEAEELKKKSERPGGRNEDNDYDDVTRSRRLVNLQTVLLKLCKRRRRLLVVSLSK